MRGLHFYLLYILLPLSHLTSSDGVTKLSYNNGKFPEYFKFGVGTSAYQIEGAWNEDGKGESIWDVFVHAKDSKIADKSTGDVACDSYHKYEEDIANLKKLGVNTYRFSIAWTRIFPYGTVDRINEKGVTYYLNLLKKLQENGIEPMVTLFHWDLPEALEKQGGWGNSTVISRHFGDYVRMCFTLFGGYVKRWLTVNEPYIFCHYGYGTGQGAPGLLSKGIGEYQCAKSMLLAHATAWRIYDEEFREKQKGKISLALVLEWYEPATDRDKDAAERLRQFQFGMYGHPLVYGNWPQIVIDRVSYRSKLEGCNHSRLPELSIEEQAFIKGTYDFFTLNHYLTYKVTDIPEPDTSNGPTLEKDAKVFIEDKPKDAEGTPSGIRNVLRWINNTYGPSEIIVLENGSADKTGVLQDDERVKYLKGYLSQILDAIEEGIPVTGYNVWSLYDNFEWFFGYTLKYGLYHVNMTDPERKRTPKKSAEYYSNVIKTRCVVNCFQ